MPIFVVALTVLLSNQAWSINVKKIEANLGFATSLTEPEDIERRVKELNEIQKNIDEELKVSQNDPLLLFLKSRVVLSYIYTISPPFTGLELKEIEAIKKESSIWILKAAKFNDNKLSLKNLYVMHDFSSELAVYSTDEIIKINTALEEKDIVELKRSKIDSLIRLGRFDEARAEIAETNQEHPNFRSEEWDEAFIGQIDEVQAKLKATQDNEVNTPTAKKLDNKLAVNEVTEVDSDVSLAETNANAEPKIIKLGSHIKQYAPFILGLLALLSLYLFNNRKRKK